MLDIRGLTKRFGNVVANRAVDLEINRGEILALLGENGAGKSTLCNVVSGMVQPDAGEIRVDGDPAHIASPRAAARLGIGMVHQHFMLIPTMTVVENVALGLRSRRPPLLELERVAAELSELSGEYGLNVDPWARIEDLSVGQRQRVEIVKVLYRSADVLLLDEPSAVLTPQEWRQLEGVLRDLADSGKAIVLVTHKLDEALGVADRCAVLRDGALVATVDVSTTSKAELARLMVGRDVVIRVDWPRLEPGDVVLAVDGLTAVADAGRTVLHDIGLEVREHEVVGIAGVDGNGQTELVEALIGVRPAVSGSVRLGHAQLDTFDATAFAASRGAVIPEDRQRTGLALSLTIRDNLIVKDFWRDDFSRRGWLLQQHIDEHSRRLLDEYDIRAPDSSVLVRQLSGGNQQKVVVAREFDRAPTLLVAAQPTRGLDVGAVEFVYERILEHKRRGGATLLLSTELDEVLSLSDRIAVISDGRLSALRPVDEIDTERLGLLMAGERQVSW